MLGALTDATTMPGGTGCCRSCSYEAAARIRETTDRRLAELGFS